MEPLIFKAVVNHSDFGKAVIFYHKSEGKLYRWLNQEDPDSGLRWARVGGSDHMESDLCTSSKLEFLVVTGIGWMRAMDLLRWARLINAFEGREGEL